MLKPYRQFLNESNEDKDKQQHIRLYLRKSGKIIYSHSRKKKSIINENKEYILPVIKMHGKIYKGQQGDSHLSIYKNNKIEPYHPDAEEGFINHKGHYIKGDQEGREQALVYAKANNLYDKNNSSIFKDTKYLHAVMLKKQNK